MFFQGDTRVFLNLFRKMRLLQEEDLRARSIRLLLLILGGAMRGIYAGGQVCALQAYGLSDVFDVAAGISTGAPAVSFFLAHQAELGTSVYSEECTEGFISWCPPSLNADYLAALFRGETGVKMLDQRAVRASRTQLFVGATCAETGNGVWLDAKKTEPDIVQAIRASIAIPGLTGPPVLVDGHPYWDGGGAFPFPLHDVIERFNPTDVLVLANAPRPKRSIASVSGDMQENAELRPAVRKLSSGAKTTFLSAKRRFEEEVKSLEGRSNNMRLQEHVQEQKPSARVAVIWSDDKIGPFTQNPSELKEAAIRAETHLHQLLALAARNPSSD